MVKKMAAVFAMALLFGCASTKGFLGLTTVSYMDSEIARIQEEEARRYEELRAELDRISEELAVLNEEVERYSELSGEVRRIISDFAEVQEATSELEQLADQVEEELERIPKETLQGIIDALQAYLDSLE